MADAEEQDVYNNSHRAFLQAFLARSVLTLEEIKPILAAVLSAQDRRRPTLPNDITEPDLSAFLAIINTRLAPLDFEIRSTHSQHDRTRIYALVNTTSDALTQLATTHSPDEIAYVKRLLDAMFETYNTRKREVLAVTSMQARQLAKAPSSISRLSRGGGENDEEEGDIAQTQGSAGQGITIAAAEKVIDAMVEEGWFEKSRAAYYSLSARALMELRGWLRDTYNEMPVEGEEGEAVIRIRDCEACMEIVTVGQRCSNPSCPCRLHNICTQRFFAAQPRHCPRCKAEWTGTDFVGEKAATGSNAARSGAARSSAARSSTARSSTISSQRTMMRTNGDVESDEEQGGEEEEEEEE
ncbi:hypothetical protein K432DRAFT_383686 [Lepidopterella palustris CBS 459.81]|uniref:Non-structural maintenance of chromosomes element 1 homolog n=1 Tax=Lepidopterella palustris CBS 459.81 TaxID=1314670 RepID=A0A8E2JDU1_9PEZI|nr:hypothetical protein K432DRAFT_383686 [Lepidopterella palustris CBS 459.81]